MSEQKPRQIAVRVMLERERSEKYVENLLDRELAAHPQSPQDRRLCQELVFGVVRWQAALDWLIARKTGGRTQKPPLRALLHVGLYQIFWLDRIPNHAAVNESVELARILGYGPQSGFINAVLRGYTREREETRKVLASLKESQPSIGYSHPDWLCKRWAERWGAAKTARLLDWNNSPPPTFARVNTLKTDAEKLGAEWASEGVRFVPRYFDWMENGTIFELESHPPIGELPSFKEGGFYIQDPSTLLAVSMLSPKPGERVLDLCAAPGGKTTYAAQLMRNTGGIMARDTQEERLALLRENCKRLGVENVTVETTIPAEPNETSKPEYDRILIDAPCSNTGVMRRRVDLRWRVRPEEIERLRKTQLQLLQSAARKLKPGGTLVYSTCSLEPDENTGVISEFLDSERSMALIEQRELHPADDGVDGAFVASLRF